MYSFQGRRQESAGMGGINDAVIPEPGTGIKRVTLLFILLADGEAVLFLSLDRPILSSTLCTLESHL